MPQIPVSSSNIDTFSFEVDIDVYNRSMKFDSASTVYVGAGAYNVLGICFSLVDSVGVEMMGVNWGNPQILPSSSVLSYTLDLSSSAVNFLFQGYTIIGYIKDQDGKIYQTVPVIKNVCQPPALTEDGYVYGDFEIIPDCINNTTTIKEFTVMVYNNLTPISVTKSGTLYYPTGTISPVSFTGTPFSNDDVYSGEYKINCTTVSKYDLGDSIYVLVTYLTNEPFPVTCSNFIGDITCCLTEVYNTYLKNCENSIGQAALQKYNSVLPSILNGLVKQINGQDASSEVALIKKQLNCNCGSTSLRQNQATPTNSSQYSIILNGQGGTTIPSPTISGNTKTYNVASKTFRVGKADTGDLAFTITIDTSVSNVVTYNILFNYDKQAEYNLDAIAASPTLINQLNSLVSGGGGSIVGLDGKCVIDLTKSNYSVSQSADGTTQITNIVINGSTYNSPSVYANDGTAVANWLNSLTLGTFTAVFSGGTLTIQSVANTNTISTITFTSPNTTKQFSSTNATQLQVFQAIINWMCAQTDLQSALANNINLCTFDYNGEIVTTQIASGSSQSIYNTAVASAICNITARMNSVTATTCASLKALFVDRPSVSFGATDRIYGTLGGNCTGMTDQQLANVIFMAVNKYSDVKAAFCGINCTAPGTCPDITNTNLAMSGSSIGVYGVTWAISQSASQTVTVKYRVTGTLTYYVATSNLLVLPNGNLSGTSPFLIGGLTVGTTYDIYIQNNCGGAGFTKQVTTPTGSVYSGSYLLDTVLYTICGGSTVTLYSSQPFTTGTTMYTDIGLTIPVTGYGYVTIVGSNIFTINVSTGVVESDTGSACATGTAGSYLLDNSTGTICSSSVVTLYTNGAFAIGKVIYTDSALSNPQTGFSYVVNSGTIYTVNSGTGAVTGTTGLNCSPPTLVQTSNTTTGPGGTRTQIAQVGTSISAGNKFSAQVYSVEVTYTAIFGDTQATVAAGLRDAINATSEATWNTYGSAPAHGTTGFPPSATASGPNLTVVLNYSNNIAFGATTM